MGRLRRFQPVVDDAASAAQAGASCGVRKGIQSSALKPEVQVRGDSVHLLWELAGQECLEREDLHVGVGDGNPKPPVLGIRGLGRGRKRVRPRSHCRVALRKLVGAVDQIVAHHPDPAQRAMEWLRFVQRELRYFSLSLGEGGFVPRQPDEIWRTPVPEMARTPSSCTWPVRAAWVWDACPALLSTTHGPLLDQFLPSPTCSIIASRDCGSTGVPIGLTRPCACSRAISASWSSRSAAGLCRSGTACRPWSR